MKHTGLTSITVSMLFFSLPCFAEDCDPAKFLKYDDLKFSQDIALQLYYLNTLSKSNTEKIDTGASFVYQGIPISGHATRDLASTLSTQLKINFSDVEKTSYIASKLSSVGKEAYLGCLDKLNDNFRIATIGDAMIASEFLVDIKSTPKKTLPNTQKIVVNVVGGKPLAYDRTLTLYQQAEAKIARQLDKQTIVSVKVGNEIQRIILPPRPNTFVIETRKSDVVDKNSYGGQNNAKQTICVELPNQEQDAAIIPGTLRLEKNPTEETKGSIIISGKPDEGPRRSCALVVWHLDTDEGHVQGKAWLVASIAKVVHPQSK